MSKYPMLSIRDLLKVHYGKSLKTDERDDSGQVPVYGSSGQVGTHIESIVDYPTIIIGRKGSVGAVIDAPNGGWPIDTTFYVEPVDGNGVHLRYIYYALRNAHLDRHTITTSIPGLNRDDLYRTEIPLPPLTEQKRIAAILDQADALRVKRRAALARLDRLVQAVFLEMFGDPVTNPMGWEVGTIDDIVAASKDVRCGPFGTQLKAHEIVDSGVPLFGIENIHNNRFVGPPKRFVTDDKAQELSSFDIKNGDVLVTRMGTIGRACVASGLIEDARFSYHLFRVRTDIEKCLPEFLSSTICRSGTFQEQLRRLAHGAIMSGLSTTNLRQVKFLIPPVYRQQQYINYVTMTEKQMDTCIQSLQQLDNLFYSLQQRAFRGEL